MEDVNKHSINLFEQGEKSYAPLLYDTKKKKKYFIKKGENIYDKIMSGRYSVYKKVYYNVRDSMTYQMYQFLGSDIFDALKKNGFSKDNFVTSPVDSRIKSFASSIANKKSGTIEFLDSFCSGAIIFGVYHLMRFGMVSDVDKKILSSIFEKHATEKISGLILGSLAFILFLILLYKKELSFILKKIYAIKMVFIAPLIYLILCYIFGVVQGSFAFAFGFISYFIFHRKNTKK